MMDYQLFKQVIVERLKEELPPIFSDYEIRTVPVKKVNAEKDAVTLTPPESSSVIAVPTLYMDDLYEWFNECQDLDKIICGAINTFVQYTGFRLPGIESFDLAGKTDRLVMNLVSTELNSELLKCVPHREYMDMSVIYRFIMSEDETGFGTVLLNNALMKDFDMNADTLHEAAYKNTLRIFPPEITRIFDGFYIMTNKHALNGATTMYFTECLEQLAEKIGEDFYIIPGSIHEVYAVPVHRNTVKTLLDTLKEGNKTYTSGSETLSASIYHYSVSNKKIEIAGSYEP